MAAIIPLNYVPVGMVRVHCLITVECTTIYTHVNIECRLVLALVHAVGGGGKVITNIIKDEGRASVC